MSDDILQIHSFDKLSFAVFNFTAEAIEDIFISEYKGSTFRGGFGKSFKMLVCINKSEKNCTKCIVNKNCSYFKIFESNADDPTIKRLQITASAPRPYVLEPPNTTQRKINKGEQFNFNLLLVGWAVEYLPYFIIVFERLGEYYGIGKPVEGKRGRFKILKVKTGTDIIYSGENKILHSLSASFLKEKFIKQGNCKKIKINFLTPTRLEIDHRPQMLDKKTGFTTFIIRLYGRLFRLQELYCNSNLGEYSHRDVETLSKNVKVVNLELYWQELTRVKKIYSEEEIKKMQMQYGGFVGEVTFEGDLTPFANMIKLGEYLHVGKYYTFGLGKYEILEID
ncbi:MAG: CRISPR system precrRNA processing endoribonuclease RAMP protein Cas6 [Ignavibacteriaceae bacterium]